jgi:hypothetical protein
MICLNKAEEGTFRHLTYNQSPPALAANQTTRQDLNGISNMREYVAAGQDDASGGGMGGMLGQTAWNDKLRDHAGPGLPMPHAQHARGRLCGMCRSCFVMISPNLPSQRC